MSTEREVRAADLKVGDLIKSYVDFIAPMRVISAPLPRQHGMVDWEIASGVHYTPADEVYTVLDLTVPEPGWGELWGALDPAYQTPEGPVWMFRKGQRVRFYTEASQQVGPEQPNVAPAVAYAYSQRWPSFR